MGEYFFSVKLSNDRSLYVAPLTDRALLYSGEEFQDTSGYFLFERNDDCDDADINIIAQIHSDESALRLCQYFNMS